LWLTPRANEPDSDPNFAARNADRGAHCHGALSSQAKGEQWRTPTSFDWKNTDCSTQVYLSDQVEGRTSKQTDFPTPRTCDWKSSPNADSNIKRMEVGQATLAEFVHAKHKKGDPWSTPRTGATESSRPNNKGGIPLADQAKREQWATPQAHDAQGPKTPEQIAAMRAKGHGVKNLNEQACWGTPAANDANKQNVMCEVNSKQAGLPKSVGLELQRQWMTPRACEAQNPPMGVDKRHHGLTHQVTKQWSTPNARDPKGAQGRMAKLGQMSDLPSQTEVAPTGQWNRANGKLNPRWVETLMGLPIGWTMPSCTSPQTIAPMSCDSLAMESCQPPQSELSEFSLAS
jgi:hypothetical protein